jgi:hypothetical protein
MMIDFLPSQYLISVVRKVQGLPNQHMVESDFLLRAVRVKNTTSKTVRITRYMFDLRTKGRSQKQIVYSEEVLQERSQILSEFAKRFLNKRDRIGEIFRKGTVYAILGTEKFWDKDQMSSTTTLEPGREAGFLFEHFRIATSDPTDELDFIIVYAQDGEEKSARINIPVIQYENKNQYIFPVKGVWRVGGNWDGPDSHKMAYSQEFAFDLDQLDSNLQVLNQKKPNEEYPCYGKEVIAVADGEVVDCFDQLPENPTSCSDLTREQIIEFMQEYGYVRVSGGNQVILKHSNREYSFYAHLIPNSLKVRKGDKVKRGQVLGNVGNSGNSEGPHLHFQLMDGPNKSTARGLPCCFMNITNCQGEPVKLIDRDRSIIHAANHQS